MQIGENSVQKNRVRNLSRWKMLLRWKTLLMQSPKTRSTFLNLIGKEANVAKQTRKKADQTKKQMLMAVDGYFDFLTKTISSYPSGGTELR